MAGDLLFVDDGAGREVAEDHRGQQLVVGSIPSAGGPVEGFVGQQGAYTLVAHLEP